MRLLRRLGFAASALGLRSESSYRFERGADVGIADWASRRCAQLILETAGGRLVPGAIDMFPQPPAPQGERSNRLPIRQAQVAAIVATVAGEDFQNAVRRSAPRVAAILNGPVP